MVMETEVGIEQNGLMDIEAVQKALNRSRASIYRYANTDPTCLNPPYNPQRLNPELRLSKDDPLLFHPNEVARFAKDVLKIKQVTIEVRDATPTPTQELLQAILIELQNIHHLLKTRN
ncbi:resolvase [Leptothermofonsia sp. ETS-13]|uniref:resolvase n=1 Tax=Leptothermofonsia sp. ETS-13 TaxID=3035696 RepID=UPI003B9E5483